MTVVCSEKLELPVTPLRAYTLLRGMTELPWRPFSAGYTHSYAIKDYSSFRLMEGVKVPQHSDRIPGYRALWILHNPNNRYIIRGCQGGEHQACSAQKPGELLLLDIDAEHEVCDTNSQADTGPWAALVIGPRGQYYPKADHSPDTAFDSAKWNLREFAKILAKMTR